MEIIHEFKLDPQYPVAVGIEGSGADASFTVTYGAHVRKGLNYAEAAHEYGECVFHALQCEGLLDDVTFED